jgi:hypothetical protein
MNGDTAEAVMLELDSSYELPPLTLAARAACAAQNYAL